MSQEFQQLQRSSEAQEQQAQQQYLHLQHENESLRNELTLLANELAKRSVLYAAHERRMMDNMAMTTFNLSKHEKELYEWKGKYEQLQSTYQQVDEERIQLMIQNQEYKKRQDILEEEVEQNQESIQNLQADLNDASTQNLTLQQMLDNLRGMDSDQLQFQLIQEVESIKQTSKNREDNLRQELSSLRDLLSQEALQKDQLLDDLDILRKELRERNDLLSQVQTTFQQGGNTSSMMGMSGFVHDQMSSMNMNSMVDDDRDDGNDGFQHREQDSNIVPDYPRHHDGNTVQNESVEESVLLGPETRSVGSRINHHEMTTNNNASSSPSADQFLQQLLALDDDSDNDESLSWLIRTSISKPNADVLQVQQQLKDLYLSQQHKLLRAIDSIIVGLNTRLEKKRFLHATQQIHDFSEEMVLHIAQSHPDMSTLDAIDPLTQYDVKELEAWKTLTTSLATFIIQSIHSYFGIRKESASDERDSVMSSDTMMSSSVATSAASSMAIMTAKGKS